MGANNGAQVKEDNSSIGSSKDDKERNNNASTNVNVDKSIESKDETQMPKETQKNNKFLDGRSNTNSRRVSASRAGNVNRRNAIGRGCKNNNCLVPYKDCKESDNADNEESTGYKGRKNKQQVIGHWK